MHRLVRLGLFVIVGVMTPALASAQTCRGGVDIAGGAHRLSLGGVFADGTTGMGVGYGAGGNGFFSNVVAGFSRYDGVAPSQFTLGGSFGSQIVDSPVFAFCPVGELGYSRGPNIDPLNLSSFTLAGGGRLGIVTGSPENFNAVPTVGFDVVRGSTTMSGVGFNETMWDTYGVASVGVGLRFNRSRSAVTPMLLMPVGVEGADPTFTVGFSTRF